MGKKGFAQRGKNVERNAEHFRQGEGFDGLATRPMKAIWDYEKKPKDVGIQNRPDSGQRGPPRRRKGKKRGLVRKVRVVKKPRGGNAQSPALKSKEKAKRIEPESKWGERLRKWRLGVT